MLSGRRKLLLADDSPTVRKVVEMFFEEEGYEVVAVGGGEEALRELEGERPPDVLLADAVMPGPDGYMLCERVKRDARLAGVPVVLLVGTFEPFNEAEARRVGADTVLTKPFQSIRDLVSKVGSLLGGESKHEGEQAQHAPAPDERADAFARNADDATPQARVEEPPHASEADAALGFGAESASPYADLGADDELIEAKPADAFGFAPAVEDAPVADDVQAPLDAHAQTPHDAHVADEPHEAERFEAQGARPSEDFQGERFGAREFERARANGHASAAHAGSSSSFVSPTSFAEENQMSAQSPFEARAASAAAEDTLLDLGQLEPRHAAAPAAVEDEDDFILDLDDEPPFTLDTPSAFAEASHGEQAASFSEVSGAEVSEQLSEPAVFFSEPTESSNESAESFSESAVPFAASAQTFSEDAHASAFSENESTFDSVGSQQSSFEHTAHAEPEAVGESNSDLVMQDGPQGFASYVAPQGLGSAPRGFVEPEVVPADVPFPAVVEGEFTDGSVEGDLPKAPAVAEATQAAAPQGEPSTEGHSVLEGHTRVEEPASAAQLSPEMIDAIARRVVEMMSDKVVREIAWEVVPELSELLIRQKLEEEGKSKG